MKTNRSKKPNETSANGNEAKPRRPLAKASPEPAKSGIFGKTDPAKQRQPASKASPKAAQGRAFAKSDTPKPRRTGTKLSRLLASNIAATTAPLRAEILPRHSTGKAPATSQWLLYCRPGFEQDCTQEALRLARLQRPVLAEQTDIVPNCGYATINLNGQQPDYRELIFSRQLIRLHKTISPLPERDRLTPILDAICALPGNFSTLWLEVPDTNDGKTLSAFTRRFQPLLETALREQGRLTDETTPDEATSQNKPQRLHLFFPDKSSVLIGTSDLRNSSSALMGIVRQSMPAEAPSRSTLKLAEAIEVFLDKSEQTRLLRQGMTAVDLGAAPGGWTWQMVKRGIRVVAVDNGPMKGALINHPLVEHIKQDGFKFTPRKSVDWLICDMVEKPSKVATLIADWFESGLCKHAIFNLKLPMKQRNAALDSALGSIRTRLDTEGINYKMIAKQLYHDREEITVFLSKTKG